MYVSHHHKDFSLLEGNAASKSLNCEGQAPFWELPLLGGDSSSNSSTVIPLAGLAGCMLPCLDGPEALVVLAFEKSIFEFLILLISIILKKNCFFCSMLPYYLKGERVPVFCDSKPHTQRIFEENWHFD